MPRLHPDSPRLLAILLALATAAGCSVGHSRPSTAPAAVEAPASPSPGTITIPSRCTGHSLCTTRPDTARPLVVVDGRIYDQNVSADSVALGEIDPNEIDAIEVMKGVNALERFGPVARHGVVIIRMKDSGGRCLTSTRWFPEPLATARSIATPAYGFAGVDSASIVLEQTAGLCHDISRLLGKVEPGPSRDGTPRPTYADVVVVRLGKEGYLVHSPWHSSTAGEFRCDKAIVLRDLRSISWLCG